MPKGLDLDDVFLHCDVRKVRNDGTVRWRGGFYEVPGEYVGEKVELRYLPLEPERPPLLYVDGDGQGLWVPRPDLRLKPRA